MGMALIFENPFQILQFYKWLFLESFNKSISLNTFKEMVWNLDDSTGHPQEYIICFNEILPLIVLVSETEKQIFI